MRTRSPQPLLTPILTMTPPPSFTVTLTPGSTTPPPPSFTPISTPGGGTLHRFPSMSMTEDPSSTFPFDLDFDPNWRDRLLHLHVPLSTAPFCTRWGREHARRGDNPSSTPAHFDFHSRSWDCLLLHRASPRSGPPHHSSRFPSQEEGPPSFQHFKSRFLCKCIDDTIWLYYFPDSPPNSDCNSVKLRSVKKVEAGCMTDLGIADRMMADQISAKMASHSRT